jgi:hypothetical protein
MEGPLLPYLGFSILFRRKAIPKQSDYSPREAYSDFGHCHLRVGCRRLLLVTAQRLATPAAVAHAKSARRRQRMLTNADLWPRLQRLRDVWKYRAKVETKRRAPEGTGWLPRRTCSYDTSLAL